MTTKVRMLASVASHMPLHFVWQYSGVCEEEGFSLHVDVAGVPLDGSAPTPFADRSERLLDGTYQFVSGLHHEPYQRRAEGDGRIIFIAQAQNDWDDRLIAQSGLAGIQDLDHRRVFVQSRSRCTFGNLKRILQDVGVAIESVEFVSPPAKTPRGSREGVDALLRGDVHAALVDLPFDAMAIRHGAQALPIPSIPVIHNASICTNMDWARSNEQLTVAFVRSMVRAIHFFKTQQDAVVDILSTHLVDLIGIEDPEDLYHLHKGWSELLSPKPYPNPLAVWNLYQLDVGHIEAINHVSPLEVWDLRFLDEAVKGGLPMSLYGDARNTANPAVTPVVFSSPVAV